jgi:nucleoside-diphosphate-sugar epimerase
VRALVTGGLGFIGTALARVLAERGDKVVLFDLVGDAAPPGPEVVLGDICDPELVARLVAGADVVFHLASVVSAGGERDFDLALRVNLDGGRNVLEACRATGRAPKLVFASTLAAFGGSGMPETVSDATRPTPQTTYGATKAVCELLLNDYSRKGFLDGRAARLPTVIIRPGAPNEAASSFASAIFREALAGRAYALPVGVETRVPVIGTRTVVDCLVRLADIPAREFGDDRVLNLPSISVTVGDMLDSLRRVAAERGIVPGAVDVVEDPAIAAIVRTWPLHARADRALALGLPQDTELDAIVGDYLDGLS